MFWCIALLLVILWAIGLVSSYMVGGAIHILPVIAIIVVIMGVYQRRTS